MSPSSIVYNRAQIIMNEKLLWVDIKNIPSIINYLSLFLSLQCTKHYVLFKILENTVSKYK